MSQFVTELPEVVVKQGKMITRAKLKGLVILLAIMLYVYILLCLKTLYQKTKRLDHIMEMILNTEKRMMNVHSMDRKLAMRMAQIDKLYEDY